MSEAENLLDQLAGDDTMVAVANPESEPHIVIDIDRFVSIPAELKRIGVQYDHNIETVTFDCPRYWDGRDLSAMRVYVNYMRSDGGVGMYLAEDVTVDPTDESIMHFSWVLSRDATKTKGVLSFLVCAKAVDGDGNEVNHWNSELNREMTISEGLEVQEAIINQYPDIITTLLVRMESVEHYYEDFKRISAETKQYVDDAIANSDADLTGYATEGYVNDKDALLYEEINALSETVDRNISDLETQVNEADSGLQQQITDINNDLDNRVDYIVERGTSDIWTWEKWNSGTVKMWCKTTTSYVNANIAMATISYPTDITLIEWGCAFVTINDGFDHMGFGLDINAKAVAKETLAGVFVHKASDGLTEDNSNIPVSLFIIGRWK